MLARALDTTRKRVVATAVLLALLIGGVAVLLAGEGVEAAGPATTAAPTTTTTEATTTTAPLPLAPLTGLPSDAGDRLSRPALFVKVDNHADARPHAGLNQADLVIEERVESNLSRLAAVFHSQDADAVGPVRSTRTTDLDLAVLFGRPIFASSGGNDHILAALRRANVVDVGHNRGGAGFWRERGRPAPHNLFAATEALRAKAGEQPPPPAPVFTYRAEGDPLPTGAVPASGVALSFGGPEVSRFSWDAGRAAWLRSQAGAPHVDTAGEQLAPANVVVLEIQYRFSKGTTESSPHGITTGEGRALVLTAGHVVEGRWVRPGAGDPLQLLAADGTPISLTPGQTFLELPPAGGAEVL
jgi:hypothetical protein